METTSNNRFNTTKAGYQHVTPTMRQVFGTDYWGYKMDYVEMLPDNRFIVSEKKVNNSLFKEILKNGSISQIEKAIRERLSVGAKNTEGGNN